VPLLLDCYFYCGDRGRRGQRRRHPAKPEEIQGGGADDNHVIVVVIPPTRGGHDALDDVEHADVGGVEGDELWNIHPDGEESKRELSKDNFFPSLHIQFDHQI
jgi:hypothetical protein